VVKSSQLSLPVAIVTLGCAKNQVDSEIMAGLLKQQGCVLVSDPAAAEVVIVNTCGFLKSSVSESIDCILDLAAFKTKGRLKRLIVAGCLFGRYGQELKKELPEVDEFLPLSEIGTIGDWITNKSRGQSRALLRRTAGRTGCFLYDHLTPRELGSPPHWAYVKIAEGCSRECSFCVIPKIRGPFCSRSSESVLCEVRKLNSRGVREVNLVAQDLTAYGCDWPENRGREGLALVKLLHEIDRSRSVEWVRLLYAFPSGVRSELLEAIVELPSVCEYLDLPLQHCSEKILRSMRRPLGRFSSRRIVEFIRKQAPQIKLRTTFLVGYPGESEKDLAELEEFILQGHFWHVGVFEFSAEEGTAAAGLGAQIPKGEKAERRRRLMRAQQKVLSQAYKQLMGAQVPVMIDGCHAESEHFLVGRTRFQAPEVDSLVIINNLTCPAGRVRAGAIGLVEITDTAGYDLVGTLKEVLG